MNSARQSITLAALVLAIAGCKPTAGDSADGSAVKPGAAQVSYDAAELAGLSYLPGGVVHHDDAARVEVKIDAAWADDGMLVIRGVFTPDDEGYHLYGSDLPRDGVSGIGRPTLLEVGNSASYSSAASAVTDKAAKTHVDETLGISLSLFPDGPVTLYLPIHFGSAPQEPVTIPVKLTYMACSDQRCHMPVEAVEQVLTVDPQAGNAEETSK